MAHPLQHGTHYITVNGAQLVYHVHGEGPVLVALPGGPGFSWHYLRMPEVEAHATLVYFELVGTGDSARLDPPSQYGRARDVADVEELRKHLGLERIGLLGHSAGGFVAQQYAITYPAHVEQLVLYDTSPTNGPEFATSMNEEIKARASRPWAAAATAALDAMFSRVMSEQEVLELGGEVMPLYFYDYDADPEPARRLLELTQLNPVRMQQAPHIAFDFRTPLAEVRVPALVVVGARDFICAPRLAEQLAAALPSSTRVVMRHSGHFAHLEEPAAFADAVAAFLAS